MGERRKSILSPEEAAKLIPSGATVTVSSSAAQLVPDKVLAGIEARFLATGEPKGLTMVFPVAVGDSFGTVGMDHLAYPGLIKRLIGGSYVNGPASKPAPKIYAYSGGAVKLYEPLQDQLTTYSKAAQYESWFMLGFGASGKDLEQKWEITYHGSEILDGHFRRNGQPHRRRLA